jgi:hypothetical protein
MALPITAFLTKNTLTKFPPTIAAQTTITAPITPTVILTSMTSKSVPPNMTESHLNA